MALRVATFSNSERLLATALRTQARVSDLQMQQASGAVSTDYGGLGVSTKPVLDLESSMSRAKSYGSAATEASNRIQVMYSTLSGITDLLSSFRSDLASMMSSDANSTTLSGLTTTAQSDLEELASLLNTNYEGRYLFAGDRTQTAPVDLDQYVADASAASTTYYTGNDTVTSVRIARDQTVDYGITADNGAFEQAFRALGSIAASGTPTSDQLQAAYDLVSQALNDTTGVQSTLSGKASLVNRAIDRQADYETQLTSMISSFKDADVTSIAVRLSSYQTQLEASYSAIAKIQSLSLASYLK